MPLTADHVEFAYETARPVLRGVSFALRPASLTVLVGPNGSGKSTLLRLLLGVIAPGAGSVTMDGRPVAALRHADRARRIGYMPQSPSVAFGFSVRETVGLGRVAVSAGTDADRRAVDAAIARVGLSARADEPFAILSAGQRQRATLARVLAQLDGGPPGSQALLADEPVSALDPRHAIGTMGQLRELARTGLTVLVVLHDLTLAARFADDALVLDESGRLAAAGPARQTLSPATLDPVFGVRFRMLDGAAPSLVALVPEMSPVAPAHPIE